MSSGRDYALYGTYGGGAWVGCEDGGAAPIGSVGEWDGETGLAFSSATRYGSDLASTDAEDDEGTPGDKDGEIGDEVVR